MPHIAVPYNARTCCWYCTSLLVFSGIFHQIRYSKSRAMDHMVTLAARYKYYIEFGLSTAKWPNVTKLHFFSHLHNSKWHERGICRHPLHTAGSGGAVPCHWRRAAISKFDRATENFNSHFLQKTTLPRSSNARHSTSYSGLPRTRPPPGLRISARLSCGGGLSQNFPVYLDKLAKRTKN